MFGFIDLFPLAAFVLGWGILALYLDNRQSKVEKSLDRLKDSWEGAEAKLFALEQAVRAIDKNNMNLSAQILKIADERAILQTIYERLEKHIISGEVDSNSSLEALDLLNAKIEEVLALLRPSFEEIKPSEGEDSLTVIKLPGRPRKKPGHKRRRGLRWGKGARGD